MPRGGRLICRYPSRAYWSWGWPRMGKSSVSCFSHKDGAWPQFTVKWVTTSSFFWIFTCLTSNDNFLIMIPIGQWHHPFSAHRTSQLARSTPIYTLIWFYSTPWKGGNVGAGHPHSVQMWKLRVREVKWLTQGHTASQGIAAKDLLPEKPFLSPLCYLLHLLKIPRLCIHPGQRSSRSQKHSRTSHPVSSQTRVSQLPHYGHGNSLLWRLSCALWNVGQPPWPLSTGFQEQYHPQSGQPKMSADTAKRPQGRGAKSPGWESLS